MRSRGEDMRENSYLYGEMIGPRDGAVVEEGLIITDYEKFTCQSPLEGQTDCGNDAAGFLQCREEAVHGFPVCKHAFAGQGDVHSGVVGGQRR